MFDGCSEANRRAALRRMLATGEQSLMDFVTLVRRV